MSPSKEIVRRTLRACVPIAILTTALCSARLASAATEATTYYVGPGGNDGGACNSAGAPCGTIQAAVNKAASGDTIQIAASTYTFSVDQCGSGVNAVVCIAEKSITLNGAGAGHTIIDGQQARRGVAVLGAGVKPFARIQNLTIRDGLAGPFGGYAATGQSQGGGMLVNNASVGLTNLQFLSNRSVGVDVGAGAGGIGAGGGLSILWIPGQLPSQDNALQNVVFDGNQAIGSVGSVRGGEAQGGAMFTYYARVTASGLTVRNNIAQAGNSGGAGTTADGQEADGLGGGVAAQEASNVTITSSTFRGNQARGGNAGQNGGNAFGGAIFGERATMNFAGLDFRENTAAGANGSTVGGIAGGGGISHDSTDMTLDRSSVIDNSSEGGDGATAGASGGGGIHITRFTNAGGTSNVVNTIIANNNTQQGSGIAAGGGGGGIWVQGPTLSLTHATLAQNSTGSGMLGKAMVAINDGAASASTVNLNYTIVANHSGDTAIIAVNGTTFNLNRGLWAANTANIDTFNGPATINGGGTMQSAGSAGFASPGSPNFDYRLASGSAAINQATGSTTPVDIEGQSRPQGSAADIGADELFVLPENLRPEAYLPLLAR